MSVQTYTGRCHCGAIRFEADIDLDEGSNRCNCSYCAKARAWFAFAKQAGIKTITLATPLPIRLSFPLPPRASSMVTPGPMVTVARDEPAVK